MIWVESEATKFEKATRTNKQEVKGSTRVANNSLGAETKTNRALVESGRSRARRTAGRVGRSWTTDLLILNHNHITSLSYI